MADAAGTQSSAASGSSQAPVAATLWSRRDFFGRLGWTGFIIVSLTSLLAAMRSAFPRVLFAPDTSFKAGFIEDFVIGETSEKFKSEYRVWIIRQAEGIYALFAKCTHLGCTPRWLKAENKFKCPCHGSGFRGLGSGTPGIHYEGPAPRPLERFAISLAEDGQIFVDKSISFRQERGEWDKPGAFLRWVG